MILLVLICCSLIPFGSLIGIANCTLPRAEYDANLWEWLLLTISYWVCVCGQLATPTSMHNQFRLLVWLMLSIRIGWLLCSVGYSIGFITGFCCCFRQRFSCCLSKRLLTLVSHSFRWEWSRNHVSKTSSIARLFSFMTFFRFSTTAKWRSSQSFRVSTGHSSLLGR